MGKIRENTPSGFSKYVTTSIKSINDKLSLCLAVFRSEFDALVESIKNGGLLTITSYFLFG